MICAQDSAALYILQCRRVRPAHAALFRPGRKSLSEILIIRWFGKYKLGKPHLPYKLTDSALPLWSAAAAKANQAMPNKVECLSTQIRKAFSHLNIALHGLLASACLSCQHQHQVSRQLLCSGLRLDKVPALIKQAPEILAEQHFHLLLLPYFAASYNFLKTLLHMSQIHIRPDRQRAPYSLIS